MALHVIVVGAPRAGKTTLLHKLVQDNAVGTFGVILDGLEDLSVLNVPAGANWIVTTTNLDNVPAHLRQGALVLNVSRLRGV